MRIEKYKKLPQRLYNPVEKLLTDAYQKNRVMADYIFGGNRGNLRKLMDMYLAFYDGYSDIYIGFDRDESVPVAAAIYVPEGGEFLSFGAAARRGLLWKGIKLLCTVGLTSLTRMVNVFDVHKKIHYDKPHVFLEILASSGKGLGKEMLYATMDDYKDSDISLNSTVHENGHAVFREAGFEMQIEVFFGGLSSAMLVKRKAKRDAEDKEKETDE